MHERDEITRIVQKKRAIDVYRNSETFDYYFVEVEGKEFKLKCNGWDARSGCKYDVLLDYKRGYGYYIIIPIGDTKNHRYTYVCYLDFSKVTDIHML